jgi:hypothetical protein
MQLGMQVRILIDSYSAARGQQNTEFIVLAHRKSNTMVEYDTIR